ncbi:uncharacterized protein si:dkey-172o19.2 [Cebidichthys violaceus]|uniref:uncharacterized protein si:dkey-172o19.2 n=1 Tax=Cebidichthys violaceus TaxID=271503 RepID=UPI0035C9DB3F
MSTSRSPDGHGAAAPCQPSSSSSVEHDPDPGLLFPMTRSSMLTRRLLRLRANASGPVARRKREMIPTDKKDSAYWDKRLKNNEAAKRSREKRRLSDLMLEGQLLALSEENAQLRAQMLSMHRGDLRAERRKAASAFATSTAPGSTLPPSPRPVHFPALFQPRLWGHSSGGGLASFLGARQQETATHPFEAQMPCLSSPRGVGGFNPHGYHNCGTQRGISPLYGPRGLSPGAALEAGRSAEMEAQRQVSSSDDIHKPAEAFPPTPDALRHASILSHRNWPHLNHSAVMRNNFLLPWRSSYLAPPAVYPDLPLYIRERPGQGLGVEADSLFKSRGPAGLPPLGMHLSPDGR